MNVKSPCIEVCELNPDGYCRGCYRTKSEIRNWLGFSDERKQQILIEIRERRNSTGTCSENYDFYV
jgi:predicted Fe-S protein YdhL (DUF1289 family)